MTIYEILCGKGDYYPGLIPLIEAYLDSMGCDAGTFIIISVYVYTERERERERERDLHMSLYTHIYISG